MSKKRIIMLGGGGHSLSCRDILSSLGYSLTLGGKADITDWVEDTRLLDEYRWDLLCRGNPLFVLGVGQIHSPQNRIDIVHEVTKRGGKFISLIAPDACVSLEALLGEAVFVGHKAVVNAGARVSDYVILNTASILEHECQVGEYSHISTGVVVNGQSRIGKRCFVGSNAVILQQIHICDDVTVGAGSVVIRDIQEKGVYVGNPAQKIR